MSSYQISNNQVNTPKKVRLFIDDKEVIIHKKASQTSSKHKEHLKNNLFDALVDSDKSVFVSITNKPITPKKPAGAWSKKLVVTSQPNTGFTTPTRKASPKKAPGAPLKKSKTKQRASYRDSMFFDPHKLGDSEYMMMEEKKDMENTLKKIEKEKKTYSFVKWTPEMDDIPWGDLVDEHMV